MRIWVECCDCSNTRLQIGKPITLIFAEASNRAMSLKSAQADSNKRGAVAGAYAPEKPYFKCAHCKRVYDCLSRGRACSSM